MKLSNCKKKVLFFWLSMVSSIPHIYPNTIVESLPAQEQAPTAQDLNKLESALKATLRQLNTLDTLLEELSLLLSSNNSFTSSKEEIIKAIKERRSLINSLANEPYVKINEATLHLLLQIIDYLIIDINEAMITNNFKKFDMSTLHKKSGDPIPSITTIEEKISSNTDRLSSLKTVAQEVGLTWYNKMYRSFDSEIVQPFQKYKLGKYLKWGAIGTLAAVAVAWQYGNRFQGYLGQVPRYNAQGHLDNEANLRWLGRANHFIYTHTKGFLPINSFLYTAFIAASLPELATLKTYAEKKFNSALNFLKGGAYTTKKTEDLDKIIPKYTLKDLVGLEHVKEIFQLIVKYVEDPERFDRTKLTPEKGFLLTGPPRTGKTFSAEALAGEIREMLKAQGRDPDEFNFFVLRASFIKERGIRWIFEKAKEVAPCILFIDEIDLLGLQRAGNNVDLLGEFLTSMSGCLENNDPKKPVIVLAATNNPQNMDKALKQRGRFGTEIRFEYPSSTDRRKFFEEKLNVLAMDLGSFTIDQMVRETERCSYEDLNALIRSAFQRAKLKGETLMQHHLDEALDRELRQIMVNYDKDLPAEEKNIVAIHQAGQALATILLNCKEKLAKVTIKPYQTQLREEMVWEQYLQVKEEDKQKKIVYGKTFTYHEHDTGNLDSLDDKIKQCKLQLAGHVAEKIVLGSCGFSYRAENAQHAFDIAKAVAFEGIDISMLPDQLKTTYLERALVLKKTWEQEITQLLEAHKTELMALTAALLTHQTLTGEEVQLFLNAVKQHLDDTKHSEQKSNKDAVERELGIKETAANT